MNSKTRPANVEHRAELYEFDYQGVTYYYTNYPLALQNELTGQVYQPLYIFRTTPFIKNATLEPKELVLLIEPLDIIRKIQTVGGIMVVRAYMTFIPDVANPLQLAAYSTELYKNRNLFSPRLMYYGIFDTARGNSADGLIELHFKSYAETLLEKKLLSMSVQNYCNNALFDELCGLNRAAFEVTANISAAVGTTLESADFAAFPDGYWFLGNATLVKGGDTQVALITAHTGNTISLQFRFTGIETGDDVVVVPGCDKRAATCLDRFSNIINMTGFPYLVEEGTT